MLRQVRLLLEFITPVDKSSETPSSHFRTGTENPVAMCLNKKNQVETQMLCESLLQKERERLLSEHPEIRDFCEMRADQAVRGEKRCSIRSIRSRISYEIAWPMSITLPQTRNLLTLALSCTLLKTMKQWSRWLRKAEVRRWDTCSVPTDDNNNQLADLLTKGHVTRDEWNHLLRLFNILSFSMFSGSHFSPTDIPQTMSKG